MAAKKQAQLSVISIIKEAWGIVRKNFSFLFTVLVIFAFYSIFRSVLQESVRDSALAAFVIGVGTYIFQTILEIGLVKISLDLVGGKKGNLNDLYLNYKMFINFFVASIFYGIVVFVGLILLVIPGIYFAIKYQFFSFLVVGKNLGPAEALSQSAKLTDGKKWFVLVFDLALIGLNILGALALVIGLIITIPVSVIAAALLYKKLSA